MREKIKKLIDKVAILDTNVIIDFQRLSYLEIPLQVFSKVFVSGFVVSKELPAEVVKKLKDLGYDIANLETEEGYSFFQELKKFKALSVYDRLVISIALQEKIICVSNDKPVRKICKKYGINSTGTLGILCAAFEKGIISKKELKELIDEYRSNSGAYINKDIINEIIRIYHL